MSFLIKAMQRICMRKHIEYSLFFFDVRIFFLLISNIFSIILGEELREAGV